MQKRHGLCKNMRGNKRGKCPEPQKKERKKSEMRGKNGQVSRVELGVQRCPLEWTKMDKCPTVELGVFITYLKKEKKKIAHVLPKQRSKRRRDSNMRSNEK